MESQAQPKERRKAQAFGGSPERKRKEELDARINHFFKLVEMDYKTFKIYFEGGHPESLRTLKRVISSLKEIESATEEKYGLKGGE